MQKPNNDKKTHKITNQIFVGGCHPRIQKNQLRDYFSQFGEVSESRLVKDKRTKKFRGFGFVTFEDSDVVDYVMTIKSHKILGKKVELKRAYTKEQTREKLLDEKMRKLYIIGIPKDLEESTIQKYYEEYGSVQDTRVIHDPEKGKENGYGFVLFKTREGLQKSLVQGNDHIIDGYQLECRQTMLREEMKNEDEDEEDSAFRNEYAQRERDFKKNTRDFKDEPKRRDSDNEYSKNKGNKYDYDSYQKKGVKNGKEDRYNYENRREDKNKRYDRDRRDENYREYGSGYQDSENGSSSRQNKTISRKSGKSGGKKSSKNSKENEEDGKITKEAVEFYKMLKMMMKQQGVQGEPLPNLLSMMASQMQNGGAPPQMPPGYPPPKPKSGKVPPPYPYSNGTNHPAPPPGYTLPPYSYTTPPGGHHFPPQYSQQTGSMTGGSDIGSTSEQKAPISAYPYYPYAYSYGPPPQYNGSPENSSQPGYPPHYPPMYGQPHRGPASHNQNPAHFINQQSPPVHSRQSKNTPNDGSNSQVHSNSNNVATPTTQNTPNSGPPQNYPPPGHGQPPPGYPPYYPPPHNYAPPYYGHPGQGQQPPQMNSPPPGFIPRQPSQTGQKSQGSQKGSSPNKGPGNHPQHGKHPQHHQAYPPQQGNLHNPYYANPQQQQPHPYSQNTDIKSKNPKSYDKDKSQFVPRATSVSDATTLNTRGAMKNSMIKGVYFSEIGAQSRMLSDDTSIMNSKGQPIIPAKRFVARKREYDTVSMAPGGNKAPKKDVFKEEEDFNEDSVSQVKH